MVAKVELHKLHAQDIHNQFGGLPCPIVMVQADYDKFIHGSDLCCYDLILQMLGMGYMIGHPPFMLDRPATWDLAIGDRERCHAIGAPQSNGDYLVTLSTY
jgi:hypothetical protein